VYLEADADTVTKLLGRSDVNIFAYLRDKVRKGDFEGHPFRGNQYTDGGGSAGEKLTSVERQGAAEDWASDFSAKHNSAIDIWMPVNQKMKLKDIVDRGGKVRAASAMFDQHDPEDRSDKREAWQDRTDKRMKEAGFKLFASEDNYDQEERVYVKHAPR
jgi:hypothetical protein